MGFRQQFSRVELWSWDVSFRSALTVYGEATIASDVVITKNLVGARAGHSSIVRIVGNGSHSPNLSAFKKSTGSGNYDLRIGIVNVLRFFYDGYDTWVYIWQDVAAQPVTNNNVLVVSFGESNSGGYALNTDAQSWEIAARPELNQWNVLTAAYQPLDIGTNNNLAHQDLNSTTHGWELGLANRIRQGYFGTKTVYYLQTGQGGSRVADWGSGGAYWNTFLSRLSAAKNAIAGGCTVAVWVSLGINDANASLSDTSYKTSMQDIISRIKTATPGCKIYVATLPAVNATNGNYSSRIQEIATADPANVRAVNASSPYDLPMRDSNHWSYQGMKRLAARMVDATLPDLALSGKGFTWSANEDANYAVFTANAQAANVPTPVDVTVDGHVAFELASWTEGQIVALVESSSPVLWNSGTPFYGGAYTFGTNVYWTSQGGSQTQVAGVTNPCLARLRWFAANDNIELETSGDGGTTWTSRKTFTNALASKSVAYVASMTGVGASYVDIWRS